MDTTSAALNRAKSYFLVGAVVSDCLTFSIGPRLLDHGEAPDPDHDERKNQAQVDVSPDRMQTVAQHDEANRHSNGEATEDTSLLPEYLVRRGAEARGNSHRKGKRIWDRLGPNTRSVLDLLYAFLNAPLLGAVLGAVIGLTPPIHRAFFNDSQQGGFFKAWLTSSIQNVGKIFASLQVVVVGVKLSNCLRKMKRGEESGTIQWQPSTIVLLMRFVIWPAISISVINFLATRTELLPRDPILLFTIMLMPAGPPAMTISSLADINESKPEEKMAVSKLLVSVITLKAEPHHNSKKVNHEIRTDGFLISRPKVSKEGASSYGGPLRTAFKVPLRDWLTLPITSSVLRDVSGAYYRKLNGFVN
ncbi:MAG: hypothetical protein Q9221_005406 [Calogaya cf. arnoldii]